jgi:hypothetical protein
MRKKKVSYRNSFYLVYLLEGFWEPYNENDCSNYYWRPNADGPGIRPSSAFGQL